MVRILFVLLDLKLSVDRVVCWLLSGASIRGCVTARCLSRCLVEHLREGVGGLLKFVVRRDESVGIVTLGELSTLGNRRLQRCLIRRRELLFVFLDQLLSLEAEALRLVLGLGQLLLLLVFLSMLVRILPHAVDLVFGEATGLLDTNSLLLVAAEIFGADVEDAVGIDVKLDLDLRSPSWGWGNAFQVELTEQPVVAPSDVRPGRRSP
jgi:hypothetical protein